MHSFYNPFAQRRKLETCFLVSISDEPGYMFRAQAIGANALEAE
jgi:hypothetical protein